MFIWNSEKDNICNYILEAFVDADEIWIAVAFLKTSGLNLIYEDIKKATIRGAKIKIFVGIDFYITEPDAVRKLLDTFEGNAAAAVYFAISKPSTAFHPKLYCFINKEYATIIAGSSNLTKGGFKDNTEICSITTTKLSGESLVAVRKYFDVIQQPEMSHIVTPIILERYASDFRKYQKRAQAHSEALKKELREEIEKIPSLNEEILIKYFERYKSRNPLEDTIKKRNAVYKGAKNVLDKLSENVPKTREEFLAEYEKLVDPSGFWWSGSIFRHKNMVAKKYEVFCKMVREVKAGTSKKPEELFAMCLEYKKMIDGLGVNVVTEVLNTYRPDDCAVLNNSPIVSLGYFGISEFPNANSFKPSQYRRLIQVLEYINQFCGLGSLGMVDNFLNFVYWELKKEKKSKE